MGTRGYFPRGKADGHEAAHSPPSSIEVNNTCNYSYVFMAWH